MPCTRTTKRPFFGPTFIRRRRFSSLTHRLWLSNEKLIKERSTNCRRYIESQAWKNIFTTKKDWTKKNPILKLFLRLYVRWELFASQNVSLEVKYLINCIVLTKGLEKYLSFSLTLANVLICRVDVSKPRNKLTWKWERKRRKFQRSKRVENKSMEKLECDKTITNVNRRVGVGVGQNELRWENNINNNLTTNNKSRKWLKVNFSVNRSRKWATRY